MPKRQAGRAATKAPKVVRTLTSVGNGPNVVRVLTKSAVPEEPPRPADRISRVFSRGYGNSPAARRGCCARRRESSHVSPELAPPHGSHKSRVFKGLRRRAHRRNRLAVAAAATGISADVPTATTVGVPPTAKRCVLVGASHASPAPNCRAAVSPPAPAARAAPCLPGTHTPLAPPVPKHYDTPMVLTAQARG